MALIDYHWRVLAGRRSRRWCCPQRAETQTSEKPAAQVQHVVVFGSGRVDQESAGSGNVKDSEQGLSESGQNRTVQGVRNVFQREVGVESFPDTR